MSSLVLAGQMWDTQGNVRERVTVPPVTGGPSAAALDGALSALRPHLSKALTGAPVVVQKDVEGFALLGQLFALRNPAGTVTGVFASVSDISERAHMEARLYARVSFEKQIADLS